MLRRAALIATGLTMAASFGLSGAGIASSTAPALKIKPGSQWTVEGPGGADPDSCEIVTFHSNFTFHSDNFADAGSWSGGAATIKMSWKTGASDGLTFKGRYTTTPTMEYKGKFGGIVSPQMAQLIEGAVAGC